MSDRSDTPRVFVVVLNWNQKELTAACLRALLRSSYRAQQVAVVDNGSADGSAMFLRQAFPGVHVISNDRNLGFAAGNNVGVRYALDRGAELVWLLNNDTEVAPDCVSELVSAAWRRPEFAFFAPKIYYFEPPDILWYAGGELQLHRAAGCSHDGIGVVDGPRFDREVEVSFVTGCALLLRRTAIQQVGLLDEDLFACAEDLDWCIRARRGGLRALYVPRARLWHKVSRSFATNTGQRLQLYLCARNRFLVQKRYAGWWGALGLVPMYLMGTAARGAFHAAMAAKGGPVLAMLRGMADGILGRRRRYPAQ